VRRRRSLSLLVLAPAVAYLTVLLALALFVVHPPALGWIGLAVASALVITIALAATRLFSRTRVNAARLHPRPGLVYRLLLVVERDAPGWQLRGGVQARVSGKPHEVFVLAPVGVSLLHFLTEDEAESRALAELRLERTLRLLGELGVPARGSVGADDPLQAIGDTLAYFPADEILIVDGEDSAGPWLEDGLEVKARDLFGVHVSGLHRRVAA